MTGAVPAQDGAVPALRDVSAALLALGLCALGLVADRALVAQGEAAREKARASAEEAARLTTVSVRAALGAIEEAVLAGRPAAQVVVETAAVPPEPSAAAAAGPPYARRSRSELTALLQSTAVTASGLPEAVVARLALGAAGVLPSSEEAAPDVAERLLSATKWTWSPCCAGRAPRVERAPSPRATPRTPTAWPSFQASRDWPFPSPRTTRESCACVPPARGPSWPG